MPSRDDRSLAQQLRQATKADHHRVDHHPALRHLLRPDVNRASYGAALTCLYPAAAGLERTLSQTIVEYKSHYTLTLREPLLGHDLRKLGQPVLPAWRFSAPASLYEMVGMLYVHEGSRLGGEAIACHAKRALGDQIPSRFFSEMPLTPAAWAGFWQFAEAMCPRDSWPWVIQGAQQAFREFTEALTNALHATTTPPLALVPTE
ncbi:biliverdin-producing heme oxygenase [Vreelandella aquamarina]|uniref:biliverdin-producing heme oxygenase n=1 Tax=Vreelandella aquamarina TaxID=77097 RepID=UPI00384A4E17